MIIYQRLNGCLERPRDGLATFLKVKTHQELINSLQANAVNLPPGMVTFAGCAIPGDRAVFYSASRDEYTKIEIS